MARCNLPFLAYRFLRDGIRGGKATLLTGPNPEYARILPTPMARQATCGRRGKKKWTGGLEK
jgi:hypothetical protein